MIESDHVACIQVHVTDTWSYIANYYSKIILTTNLYGNKACIIDLTDLLLLTHGHGRLHWLDRGWLKLLVLVQGQSLYPQRPLSPVPFSHL